MTPEVVSLILKVTTSCNLNCVYCYMDRESHKSTPILNLNLLEKIISDAQNEFSQINYIWHGGEPLLVGEKYFNYVNDLQKFYLRDDNQIINNSIQTNGTLLNQKFIKK